MLFKAYDNLALEMLRVKMSPACAMTSWIDANEAPKGFTIDQDAKLVAHTEDKATVKYSHHTLGDDIQGHIAAGKQCVELAMTWNDKISFVLTESLTIKRIKALDILDESKGERSNADERFDGDFVLMAAELGTMLNDLVHALGGAAELSV